jgi:hypothetical protein
MTRIVPGGREVALLIDRSELAILGIAVDHATTCEAGYDEGQCQRAEAVLDKLRDAAAELDDLEDAGTEGR